MNHRLTTIVLVSFAALLPLGIGCGESNNATQSSTAVKAAVPKAYFTRNRPEEVVDLVDVKTTAAVGDEVTFLARVGGRMEPRHERDIHRRRSQPGVCELMGERTTAPALGLLLRRSGEAHHRLRDDPSSARMDVLSPPAGCRWSPPRATRSSAGGRGPQRRRSLRGRCPGRRQLGRGAPDRSDHRRDHLEESINVPVHDHDFDGIPDHDHDHHDHDHDHDHDHHDHDHDHHDHAGGDHGVAPRFRIRIRSESGSWSASTSLEAIPQS